MECSSFTVEKINSTAVSLDTSKRTTDHNTQTISVNNTELIILEARLNSSSHSNASAIASVEVVGFSFGSSVRITRGFDSTTPPQTYSVYNGHLYSPAHTYEDMLYPGVPYTTTAGDGKIHIRLDYEDPKPVTGVLYLVLQG